MKSIETTKQRIKEILNKEKTLMKGEYKHGKIYLTNNYLLWEKREKFDDAIIPLNSIRKCRKASKWGAGECLKVYYNEGKNKALFPLASEGLLGTSQTDDIQSWILTLNTRTPTWVSDNIVYEGGHSAYPKKRVGRLSVTPDSLIFVELRGIELQPINFRLEIPLNLIENVSIKETSELRTLLHGYFESITLPTKSRFILIEYKDEINMKQNPLFNVRLDPTDTRKDKLLKAIYEHSKKIKIEEKEHQDIEDPTRILRVRYAKGEINKEEYEETKKVLES